MANEMSGQQVGWSPGRIGRWIAGIAVVVALAAAACTPVPRTPRPDTPVPPPGTPLLPSHLDCLRWRYDGLTPTQPPEWDEGEYRLGSFRDPSTMNSPHRLCGQVGAAADLAWTLDRGRSDVVIAVLDSGIEWRNKAKMPDLVDKTYINRGELPVPIPAGTGGDPYDSNGDRRFTVSDYASDPRVSDRNGTDYLDPEDLISTFSDGTDADENSYVDDTSGWDLQNNDNNPLDDVDYGHGSGEARDAVGAHDSRNGYGTCPECLALHVRVADSFIAEGGRFAAGVIFSLDAGADVILEALGAISNPPQAQAAIDAAYYRGVPIAASMADEQSQHANLPAAMNHTIPMNSITELPDLSTISKVVGGRREAQLLNGCTNYGGIAWVSVPSTGCSSEATGNGGGMLGLINAAARNAGVPIHPDLAARGLGGPGQNVLSANETAQLVRAGADDIDFATPNNVDPANEFTDEFGQPRLQTVKGWDATHGYGQLNLYESVKAVRDGRIPPEADITGPEFFETLPVVGNVDVRGRVAAVRASSYSYRVEWTTGLQTGPHPAVDNWRVVEQRSGLTAPVDGLLGRIDLA
ncbi:MAG: S8 family serine peptidase, partial [Actinomycetota bacterium]